MDHGRNIIPMEIWNIGENYVNGKVTGIKESYWYNGKLCYKGNYVNDVLEIITHFSAKLYGKRSHMNEKILNENKKLFGETN